MHVRHKMPAKISVGEPWDFCTPSGEGSFNVIIEKMDDIFILAKVISPFEWRRNFIKYVIGTCRHDGAKTSDVESPNGVHLNIVTLDCDIDSVQHLDLEAAWKKGKFSLIGKMTVERK